MSSVSSLNSSKSPKKMDVFSSITSSKSIQRRQVELPGKCSKKSKISPQKTMPSLGRFDTALIGDVALSWSRFNIKSTLFNGTSYTIVNTCSLDSVLFIYHFIFKTASTLIINLFKSGKDPIYHIINETMELVDTDGWDVARLYWLTSTHRLSGNAHRTHSTASKSYNIFGTIDENVYQYLRAMQMNVYSTEFTAVDCSKRQQSKKCAELTLR